MNQFEFNFPELIKYQKHTNFNADANPLAVLPGVYL